MKAKLYWHQYHYFPYERRFAVAEAQALFGVDKIEETRDALVVAAEAVTPAAALRLTYFSRVQLPDGTVIVPHQTELEASSRAQRGKRQVTRYSAHGLHEYKGKFNPQVVRAIGNRLALRAGANVLDPFSGSGTTLLEAAHASWNAIGIDRNPLAVMISNAKIHALRLADGRLSILAHKVSDALRRWIPRLEFGAPSDEELDTQLGANWKNEIHAGEYLQGWFPAPVVAQIVLIRRVLSEHVLDSEDRRVFEVLVSDQLRDCSLQEPADLRIRRRKEPAPNYPLISKSLAAIEEHAERISAARQVLGDLRGSQRALLGDARRGITSLYGVQPDSVDAIICSPPYATALPYIDTQRLSLVMFGLLDPAEIRMTEGALVGARDISLTERHELETEMTSHAAAGLPAPLLKTCREMLEAARRPGNGFRRRNTPALVYRYFRDMAYFFQSVLPVLRPGATAALVVGANRTTLGGRVFNINTPKLLAGVAMKCGFEGAECEVMDTYQRYDLHQKNSISNEMLVLLRRPLRSRPPALRKHDSRKASELLVRNEAVALASVADERYRHFVEIGETRVSRRKDSQLELGL